LRGFEDGDFEAASFSARGPFLKFRVKADETRLGRMLPRAAGQ
jgi:hypothetical protein